MRPDRSNSTIDDQTGRVQYHASLFVAVLPYSNYEFVGVYPDQTLASWIRGHVEAFTAFGGVPRLVVPDNPKPLVSDARGDVILNPTYQALGEHYRCALVPARVRRPRDKAKAEGHVLIVERWILMALRHIRITSLAEAQEQVRAFQKWPGTRRQWWEEERDALQPLPATTTAIASQTPVDQWHGLFQDPTVADAVLDRLVHHAHHIPMRGESMRKVLPNRETNGTTHSTT